MGSLLLPNQTHSLAACTLASTINECKALACCIWDAYNVCAECVPLNSYFGPLFSFTDNERCSAYSWRIEPWLIGIVLHVACYAPLVLGLVYYSIRTRQTMRVPHFTAAMLDAHKEMAPNDEGKEIDVVAAQTQPPEALLGVSMRCILSSLARGEPPAAIITELFHGSRYLRPIPSSAKVSIISYRCCAAKVGKDGSKEDDFTLDEHAFLSALAAAQAHGIDFLWLDCWAYRKQPPWGTYVHRDFCVALATVMWRIDHVIWLPRSRAWAPGQYQYRVWCTFEAAMVAFRSEVGVSIAGYPPDARQARLHLMGSYLMLSPLPPWPNAYRGHRDISLLATVNMIYYAAASTLVLQRLLRIVLQAEPVVSLIFLLVDFPLVSCVWLFVRVVVESSLPARRMASNGRSVLRIMLSAARATAERTPRRVFRAAEVRAAAAQLEADLCWLDAYDRRDVIAVKVALDALVGHLVEGGSGVHDTAARVISEASTPNQRSGASEASASDRQSKAAIETADVQIEKTSTRWRTASRRQRSSGVRNTRVRRASLTQGTSANQGAIALAVHKAAYLRGMKQDATNGRSPREWLAAVQIQIYDFAAGSSIVQSIANQELDGEPPVLPWTTWLDGERLDDGDSEAAVEEDASESKLEQGGGQKMTVATALQRQTSIVRIAAEASRMKRGKQMSFSQVAACHIRVHRGIRCFVVTPMGSFYVAWPKWEGGKWVWDMRACGRVPDVFDATFLSYNGAAFLLLYMHCYGYVRTIGIPGLATQPQSHWWHDKVLWVGFVGNLLCGCIVSGFTLSQLAGWAAALRSGNMPTPIFRRTAKLEMLVLYAAFIYNTRPSYEVECTLLVWHTVFWGISLCLPAAIEIPPVLIATVVSAVRSRDPRFLFEFWSSRVELRNAVVA